MAARVELELDGVLTERLKFTLTIDRPQLTPADLEKLPSSLPPKGQFRSGGGL
jgi:hypothetical protein